MALPRQPQRIISSDDESQSDSGSDSSAASSEDETGGNPMIDLEAADEDDESASSSGDESSIWTGPTFSKFLELPPELRDRIWDFFCPDLVLSKRFLHIVLDIEMEVDDIYAVGATDAMFMVSETEPFRTFSSIHRASRQRALHVAPNELQLNGYSPRAIVRFHAARDIIHIDSLTYLTDFLQTHDAWVDEAQNFAFNSMDLDAMSTYLGIFPQIRTVYNVSDQTMLNDRWLRWCVSDYAQMHYYEHVEALEPVPSIVPLIHCYPDAEKYPDFHKYNLPRLAGYDLFEDVVEEIQDRGIDLRPMIAFLYHEGMGRFERLELSKHLPLPELPNQQPSRRGSEASGDEGSESDEPDEYESDGIDDEEVVDYNESSEDELVPDPISPGSGTGRAISVSSSEAGEPAPANFSSPEPSEDEGQAASAENQDIPPASGPSRKRRIVTDSDDGNEDGGDGDEEAGPSRAKRRRVARTLESDSETETGDVQPVTQGAAAAAESSDDESSSSSSEESEEAPEKPISLAQRLRGQQQAGPQSISSGSENSQGEDEDSSSSEDEEDEDERPRRGGGMFLDEASEDEDDDEDGGSDDDDNLSY